MNRRNLGILLLLVCVVVPAGRAAAQDITMDLAALPPGEVTTRPGGVDADYTIKLVNVVPSLGAYDVDITIEEVPIPALVFPGAKVPGGGRTEAALAVDCNALIRDLNTKLDAAKTEIAVRDIGEEAVEDAPDECKVRVRRAFESATTQLVDNGKAFHVRSSQTLTIKVTRAGGGATWTMVLPGIARGEWRTSYGFFFVPNRDDKWYTKKNDGADTFKILKQADRELLDFVPTVLFTFLPSKQRGNALVRGWTAGLGYDLEKPFVFGGYSWAYNENIIFSGGIAFHRQSRLLGKYHRNDDVGEALESSQLVEDTYGPNVYVGIGFRFGEDIHARRNELEAETAKAQQETAAAKDRAQKAEADSASRRAACEALAAGKAQERCKDDEACLKKAADDAKEACAVTESDRATVAAEKAERRKRCDAAADSDKKVAMDECAKKPEREQGDCEDKATKAFNDARTKCIG